MTTKSSSSALGQASNSSGFGRSNDSAQQQHHGHTQQVQQQQNHGSSSRIRLTAKPHGFAGAVLSPKHAQELTPSLCLAITSALAQQQHQASGNHQQLPHRRQPNNPPSSLVPYTLWITEAWRVLGWAEPSAALFWEVATMYHALIVSHKAYLADWKEGVTSSIPPILSCGSASSLGSGTSDSHHMHSAKSKKYSSAASAKELPVWLVGTFLLLHTEEFCCQRNLSGQDSRRFYSTSSATLSGTDRILTASHKVDFTALIKNSSLSPR
jgi:hypothetical protein